MSIKLGNDCNVGTANCNIYNIDAPALSIISQKVGGGFQLYVHAPKVRSYSMNIVLKLYTFILLSQTTDSE